MKVHRIKVQQVLYTKKGKPISWSHLFIISNVDGQFEANCLYWVEWDMNRVRSAPCTKCIGGGGK